MNRWTARKLLPDHPRLRADRLRRRRRILQWAVQVTSLVQVMSLSGSSFSIALICTTRRRIPASACAYQRPKTGGLIPDHTRLRADRLRRRLRVLRCERGKVNSQLKGFDRIDGKIGRMDGEIGRID